MEGSLARDAATTAWVVSVDPGPSVAVKGVASPASYSSPPSPSQFFMEMIFFPGLKEHWWISNVGLALVVLGELIRIVAMITAGRAFTHQLKTRREEQHRMVRHGIYGIVRHPGYLGYLVWIVGIQVMLLNPVCAVVIGIAVRNFFAERISQEEYHLKSFFGPDYIAYAQRVPSGIPFVN